jgi:nucleotide-binding universal stress UspA family protein
VKLFKRVLVAVADPEKDAALLRYALEISRLEPGAQFEFIHVTGWSGARGTPPVHRDILRHLRTAVEREFGELGGPGCRVVHGNVLDRLLEAAAEGAADLILVGHGANRSGRRALARRLAMQAPCSVWMRPEGAAATVRNVLVALDYSESSAFALAVASRIARESGGSGCLALHVYQDRAAAAAGSFPLPVDERERQAFQRFTAPLDTNGVALTPVFEADANVARAVRRVTGANGVDLVVMGSRGQARSASILLGSESEDVLMESEIPVLIAKRRGERMGLLQVLLDREFHLQEPPRLG